MITKEELYGDWIIREVHYSDNESLKAYDILVDKYKFTINENRFIEDKKSPSDNKFRNCPWELKDDYLIIKHYYLESITRIYKIEKISENFYKFSPQNDLMCNSY